MIGSNEYAKGTPTAVSGKLHWAYVPAGKFVQIGALYKAL
jgi:hypothetical protein